MVPSSSEDVTRAMRGLPKRFSRNYLREMAVNVVKSRLYVLNFKRSFVAEMFSALSAVFFSAGLSFALCSLAVHYFAVYSVLGNLIIGSLSKSVFGTRTATGSKPFSLLTCLHSTTFILLSIFSPLEMISIKIWEAPLSWHLKCFLPVGVASAF